MPCRLARIRALQWGARRGLTSLVLAGSVVAMSLVALPATAGTPATVGATPVGQAFDETTAAVLAKSQGQPVEVLRLRTETDQVFKNPDGTFTRNQYAEPVRVKRGAIWVPVDSSLTRVADGALVPAASAVEMVFSPGGSGPLVSVSHAGVGLALTWPAPLPAPTVSGDTATYPEVYPGVDLTMTSVGTSFTEHLIVKTPAAGRQAAVRSLTLGTRVAGGRLVAAAGGGFTLVDRAGRAAWSSPAPLMWDSSSDVLGTAATTPFSVKAANTVTGVPAARVGSGAGPRLGQDGAREGDTVTAMGQRVDPASMLLTADTALLDSAKTVYPVTIDPTTGPVIYNWAMVDKTYPTTSYYNFTDADQGVGYQNFYGVDTKRLFYAFVTTSYLGKDVTAATLSTFETYSGSCSAGTVNAYLTANFAYGMTWNTQPAHVGGIQSSFSVKAGRSDCNPGGYLAKFDVKAGLRTRVAGGFTVSTFGLEGASETTTSSWMRFAGSKNATIAKRPFLSVTYNSTPSTPSTAKMFAPDTATTCGTTLATTKRFNQTSSTANMIATGVDSDGGNLSMTFSLYNAATGLHQNDHVIGPKATTSAGAQFIFKVPATWGDGGYYWISKVSDGVLSSAWSAKCYITLDKTAPLQPTITSATFTDDTLAPADVTYGAFTLASVGATSFDYYWNGVLKANLKTNGTSDGAPAWTGNMSVPVTAVGWLQVIAIDGAGNHSPMSNAFYVKKAVAGKLAQYLFNDATPGSPAPVVASDTANDPSITAAEASHYAFDLSATGIALDAGRFAEPTCWDPDTGWTCTGIRDQSLGFGGTAQEATSLERPVASERSFTVGAWVRLTDDSASRTLIAQNLEVAPAIPTAAAAAYDVGYDQVTDRFVFHVTTSTGVVLTASDGLPATVVDQATGTDVPLARTGKWVYLAAIYDSVAGSTRLDAAHEDLAKPPGDPNATFVVSVGGTTSLGGVGVKAGMGTFRVGDGAQNASPWAGQLDNLSIWQQALSDSPTQNDVANNAGQHL